MKGKLFYWLLPFLILFFMKMYHWCFVFFLIPYFLFFKRYFKSFMMILIGIFMIGLFFFISLPKPLNQTVVSGTIVNQDDKSIVVKMGYHKVKVYGEFDDFRIYDQVRLKIYNMPLEAPTNDYAFNYQYYLYSMNIFNQAKCIEVLSHHRVNHPYHLLEKRVNQNVQTKSFVSLFVLGIKDETMREVYQKMTQLSIVHMFALSGMHLSLLKKWLTKLGQMFFPQIFLKYLVLIMIGIYVYWIPYNISFLRAYLMMVGQVLFKKYLNQLDILSILTISMLFYNPYLLYNLSFIFSYFMYFIVLLLNRHRWSEYYMMLGSIPILICVNHRIPLLSFVLSIVCVPYIELLYQFILSYMLLGQIVAPLLSLSIHLLNYLIEFCYGISYSLHFSHPTLMFIMVYYYFYFKGIIRLNSQRTIRKELMMILACLVAFYFYPHYRMESQVVMIDVGQGDCFFIQQPFNLGNVLIDTGGLKNRDLATDTIIPYLESQGVKCLDAVFISHEDYDHAGALDSLLEHFGVKQVIKDFKEIKIGKVLFKRLLLNRQYSDANDQSQVIYAKIQNLKYLFTGDISSHVEQDLIERYPHLKVDVLKVSHHGSHSATSAAFLRTIQPKIALISVGKHNLYRHPHYEVVQRLKHYGIHVYRSDEMGMIKIISYGFNHYIYS